MLSFVLYVKGQPLIVDMGISTYEKNDQRNLERSTASHNTVVIDDKNQSDVWGGFRVGKRADIKLVEDLPSELTASHNGYYPVIHKRNFAFDENIMIINDNIIGDTHSTKAVFHFHPDEVIKQRIENTFLGKNFEISFQNCQKVILDEYQYPLGYNRYNQSNRLIVFFKDHLKTIITIR